MTRLRNLIGFMVIIMAQGTGCGESRHPAIRYPGACGSPTECMTLALEKLEQARQLQESSLASVEKTIPLGTIVAYAGVLDALPPGWKHCNGDPLSRKNFSRLFEAIGTAWGNGDGVTNFNLPDLRGIFLRGVDASSGRDPDRGSRVAWKSGGNQGDQVGTYELQELSSHDHVVKDPPHAHELSREILGNCNGGYLAMRTGGGAGSCSIWDAGAKTVSRSASGISIEAKGGSETRPVNGSVYWIIKVN